MPHRNHPVEVQIFKGELVSTRQDYDHLALTDNTAMIAWRDVDIWLLAG